MLTLKKVKELVNAPVHTKRVPSPKVLLEEGRIFLRKEFEHGSHLTLYHNGYVWFSAGKRNTVFHIHDCRGDYAYGASKGKGEVIKEEYFENCEWHILNVGKIPPFNPNHFRQCFSCQTLCLSCSFDICAEGFKTGTIFNFRHITSPSYIV